MGKQVPSATRALRVLRFLATQPDPVPLQRVARAAGMPRSSAYHLLNAMIAEGFVTHVEEQHRYGLGVAAFAVGSGYTRQAPLQRIARRRLATLVDEVGESAHLAVLHGRDVYYVIEERARGRPPLVTDVDVRLPAQTTASGRAILASLPRSQLRALYPTRATLDSGDRARSAVSSLHALDALLREVRRRGHAVETDEVTSGFSSVAAAVLDHNDYPVAAVAVTYETGRGVDVPVVVRRVVETADGLTHRLSGRP